MLHRALSSKRRVSSRRRFACVAGAVALAAIARPAAAAQFDFKCGDEFPADHPASIRLAQMWASIEQESQGRVRTQFFPNNLLGSPSAMFNQLRLGALQFQLIAPSNLAAVVPAFDITSLGFAFRSEDEGLRALDGPLSTYLRNEAAAKGVYVFRKIWNIGMYVIGSTPHPIRTPDDLHGFKIRIAESKIFVDLFKELGANPTPLSFNEIYTALQTKLIDGESASALTLETSRFYEINRYVGVTNHSWACSWLIANGEVWKSLPPDLQETIERNATRYVGVERSDTKAGNAAVLGRLRKHGLGIDQPDQAPFRRRLGGYYGAWSATLGSTAMGLLERELGRKLG